MALRHEFPLCKLGEVNWSEEKLQPVRAMRTPVEVGFRNGADLDDVVGVVSANRNVSLVAACGSGKSVRVPLYLSAKLGKLVVHSVPSAMLASSLGDYVASTTTQSVTVVSDADVDFPSRGVVLVSNAVLLARLLSDRSAFADKFILFMDESHESDCYTAVLRQIGPSLSIVDRFMTATATAGPEGFRMRETSGTVHMKKFDDLPAAEWDVETAGKPWSVSQFDGNVLIFVEQSAAINHLHAAYAENGCDVFVMNARMPAATYAEAIRKLKDDENGIVVLLADYSFRSGYTLPNISHVIDTGKVVYQNVDDKGNPGKRIRKAYKFEMEQAAGRAGRIAGSIATVAQPRIVHEPKICDLEGVEVDAAVLLYRLLGFKPPSALKFSPFYSGKIPRDIVDALRSPMALRCLAKSELVDWTECKPGSIEPQKPASSAFPVSHFRKFVMPPTPTTEKPRESVPSPTFSYSDSVLEVPRPELTKVVDARVRSRPSKELLVPVESHDVDDSADSPNSVLEYYSGESRPASRSVSPSVMGHRRHFSSSSATTVSVDGDGGSSGFEADFARVMNEVMDTERGLQPGKGYYYNDLCANAPDRTITFPAGLESVVQLMSRSDAARLASVMRPADRSYALSVLTDAYNDAMAEVRAIHRLGAGFKDFIGENQEVVERNALRDWVQGLAEILTQQTMLMRVYAKSMCDVIDYGYHEFDAMTEAENKLIEMHVTDLRKMTSVRERDKLSDYQARFASRAIAQSSNRSARSIEYSSVDHDTGMVYGTGNVERPRITAGQVRTRDMLERAGRSGLELGRAKYKLQPSTGLRSIWTRPLMRLIGQGDVKIELH